MTCAIILAKRIKKTKKACKADLNVPHGGGSEERIE